MEMSVEKEAEESEIPSTSPNSFLSRTTLYPGGSRGSRDRMMDVFPAPKKPVKTVMGIFEEETGTTIVYCGIGTSRTETLCSNSTRWTISVKSEIVTVSE